MRRLARTGGQIRRYAFQRKEGPPHGSGPYLSHAVSHRPAHLDHRMADPEKKKLARKG